MCYSMVSILSICPRYPVAIHYFQTDANRIYTKEILRILRKRFNSSARDPFLMIIWVENFKEHRNQISLSSEASFH